MKLKTLIFISFLSIKVFTQQTPLSKQYLVNRYCLSPAFSGFNQNYEVFVSYRNDLAGIDGSPKSNHININGPIAGSASLGADLMNDRAGIFKNTSAVLNYTYHVKIYTRQYISLALQTEISESHIDLTESKGKVGVDPQIGQYDLMSGTVFNFGFGLNYSNKSLNFGVFMPRLLKSKVKNVLDNNNSLYTILPYYRLYSVYNKSVNHNIDFYPCLVFQLSASGPIFLEVSSMFVYQHKIWAGLSINNNTGLGLFAGALPNGRICIHYSYELPGKIYNTFGSHEVTLGFLMGRNNAEQYRYSVFGFKNAQPYINWIDKD